MYPRAIFRGNPPSTTLTRLLWINFPSHHHPQLPFLTFCRARLTPEGTTRRGYVLLSGVCARASHACLCCLPCQGPQTQFLVLTVTPKVSSATIVDRARPMLPDGGRHFPNITSKLPWAGAKKRATLATDAAIASPPAVAKASDVGPRNPSEDK